MTIFYSCLEKNTQATFQDLQAFFTIHAYFNKARAKFLSGTGQVLIGHDATRPNVQWVLRAFYRGKGGVF